MSVLEISRFSKKYPKKTVFNNFNASFESGKIYGLFGPNGIGKTTLLKSIAGLVTYNGGEITYDNQNLNLLKDVSYYGDNILYYKWMNVKSILNMTNDLYHDFNKAKCEDFLATSGINFKQKIKSMSKGQQEIIFLSITLCRDVKLYILDEPFGAIDINKQEFYIKNLATLFNRNSTMIIATHYPQSFHSIFDEVCFINDQEVIYQESYLDLINQGSNIVDKYNELY